MKSASIVQSIIDFGRALRRFQTIILALLWREAEIRRQNPSESLLELAEPILMILSIHLIRYVVHEGHMPSPLGGNEVLFLATGFYPKYLFMHVSNIIPRGSPRRRFPVEQRLDHALVRIIYKIIEHAFVGLVFFGTMYFFLTTDAMPHNILPIIPALAASVTIGFGWGMLNVVLARFLWFWRYFNPAISRALIIFSGALFVPDFMPPDVRYILSFNPEVHAIALFRTAFYPHYPTLVLDTTYLAFWAIFCVFLALMLERVTRRFEGRQ